MSACTPLSLPLVANTPSFDELSELTLTETGVRRAVGSSSCVVCRRAEPLHIGLIPDRSAGVLLFLPHLSPNLCPFLLMDSNIYQQSQMEFRAAARNSFFSPSLVLN